MAKNTFQTRGWKTTKAERVRDEKAKLEKKEQPSNVDVTNKVLTVDQQRRANAQYAIFTKTEKELYRLYQHMYDFEVQTDDTWEHCVFEPPLILSNITDAKERTRFEQDARNRFDAEQVRFAEANEKERKQHAKLAWDLYNQNVEAYFKLVCEYGYRGLMLTGLQPRNALNVYITTHPARDTLMRVLQQPKYKEMQHWIHIYHLSTNEMFD